MNRRVALIGDLSCHARASISSQIPIVSAFGDMASYAFPTYLSNSVDYTEREKFKVSENFNKTLDMWETNGYKFDAIITGYIDDSNDIIRVRNYIEDLKLDNPRTLALIDPCIADEGNKYCTITDEHITNYKKLMEIADVITPNLTEACIFADVSYDEYKNKYSTIVYKNGDKENSNEVSKKIIESIFPLLEKLIVKKNQVTIITGIELYNSVLTLLDIYDGDHAKRQTTCNYAEKVESRKGAGDLFDALYLEACINGFNMVDALSLATSFINNAFRFSRDQKYDVKDGIIYEPILVDNMIAVKQKQKEIQEKIKEMQDKKNNINKE